MVQDPLAKMGPYAFSKANLNWVGYDDPAFAVVKSKYVLSMGLGGAMVWDISTDDFGNLCGGGANPIIKAISQTVLSNQPATTVSPITTTTQGTTGKFVTIPTISTTTIKVTTSTTTSKGTTKPTGICIYIL